MKKTIIWSTLSIALLSLFCIRVANAQGIKKVAQTGLQFLSVDVAARPASMGGAFALAGTGAEAVFYNPAGMAGLTSKIDAFASTTSWIADINIHAGALVMDYDNLGVFGVSFVVADYGQSIGTQVVNDPTGPGFIETGDLDMGAYAIGLSYARRLSDKFKIGGQVKYASEKLGSNVLTAGGSSVDNSVGGLAFDFGTSFYPGFRSFRLGMSVRNFSPQFKYEDDAFELPLTFCIGVAMDVLDLAGSPESSSLTVAIDALHPRAYAERMHFGAEYWYIDTFALRAGYKSNYDEEGLSLGAGIKYAVSNTVLRIDYSYTDLGAFSTVNRFSIGASF